MEVTDLSPSATSTKASDSDWYIRPYRAGDEGGLLALYERAFKRPRDSSHWRWKLLGRQSSFNMLWVAAVPQDDGGEHIVGHYGGIPIKIKLNGKVYDAVHAVEAMTDPSFRRKGMLTRLGGTAHETWAAAGQPVVTGLPNDQWGTRNRALGYLPVFPLSWLRFPAHLERALWRRSSLNPVLRVAGYLPALLTSLLWRTATRIRSSNSLSGITVEINPTDNSLYTEIWQRAATGWPNIQVRDNDWVRWRYIEAAPQAYDVAVAFSRDKEGKRVPVGYAAFRVVGHGERRNGYIADLLVERDAKEVAWALINAALVKMDREGAGTVMTLAPPGSPLYSTFRNCGFLPTKSETAFSFEIVALDPTFEIQSVANPADWHLTGGDFDVI